MKLSIKLTIATYHHSIQNRCNAFRCFASQTLLSRTDYQDQSTRELREELHKRGIITRSKKKTFLIDQLLEFERGRRISLSSHQAIQHTRLSSKTRMTGKSSFKSPDSHSSSSLDQSTITVSSPTQTVTRLISELDGVVPIAIPIQTGSNSASLGSPITTMTSAGYQAKNWPACIHLPTTAVEEPLETVIPFIPDLWSSHQQSHAPQLIDIQSSPADLSTTSHPSTLPEGGPSLIVDPKFSIQTNATDKMMDHLTKLEMGRDPMLSNLLPWISHVSSLLWIAPSSMGRFEFEDRALNNNERTGLIRLITLLGGSWILATWIDH